MRIVMMGTGPFAVPTFNALLESPHEVVALVTRPVPPARGRGKSTSAVNPMRDRGEQVELPIYEPDSVNAPEFQDTLKTLAADLFVVCDYGQILSRTTLTQASLGGINLHASLLPKYRGAAPINWALYHGERETGVTVIHMTPRLDGGPCLIQVAQPIDDTIDAIELEQVLAHLGVDAVLQAIDQLAAWDGLSPLGTPQEHQKASRAPRLTKHDGMVDWHRSAWQIRDQVRAFKPWPGTYTFWQHPKRGRVRLTIGQVSLAPLAQPTTDGVPAGTVVHVDKQHLVVACGSGFLQLEQVQPEGKKMLPVAEFLRGYMATVGDRLQ